MTHHPPPRAYARPVGHGDEGEGVPVTIFERYGGFATMRRVISTFYDSVLDSPVLSHHFVGVDMRSLINHQTQFIAHLTGGPGASYSDDALLRMHAPLHITAEEFAEMRRLLREALEDHDFADADVDTIDRAFASRSHVIVTAS
jgi:hemoglobin